MMLGGGGSLQDFKPTVRQLENLKNSWFLYTGAFQGLYRQKTDAIVPVGQNPGKSENQRGFHS